MSRTLGTACTKAHRRERVCSVPGKIKARAGAIRTNQWEGRRGRGRLRPITKGPQTRLGRGVCSLYRGRSGGAGQRKGQHELRVAWAGNLGWDLSMVDGPQQAKTEEAQEGREEKEQGPEMDCKAGSDWP